MMLLVMVTMLLLTSAPAITLSLVHYVSANMPGISYVPSSTLATFFPPSCLDFPISDPHSHIPRRFMCST